MNSVQQAILTKARQVHDLRAATSLLPMPGAASQGGTTGASAWGDGNSSWSSTWKDVGDFRDWQNIGDFHDSHHYGR